MSTFPESFGRFVLPNNTVVLPKDITGIHWGLHNVCYIDKDTHLQYFCWDTARYDRPVGRKDKNGVEMFENDRVISADREYTIIFSLYTGWMLDTGISKSSLGDREDIEVVGHVPFGKEG